MEEEDTRQAVDASPEPSNEIDPRDAHLMELPKVQWVNLPNWQPAIVINMMNTQGQDVEVQEEAFVVAAVDAYQNLWQFRVEPEKTFEKARLT